MKSGSQAHLAIQLIGTVVGRTKVGGADNGGPRVAEDVKSRVPTAWNSIKVASIVADEPSLLSNEKKA